MVARLFGSLLAFVVAQAVGPAPTTAQGGVDAPRPAVVPFGLGEKLEYDVKLGVAHVGNGYFRVGGIDTVRGHPTYRLESHLHGGVTFVKVDENMTSWMDVVSLISRRFEEDKKEFRYQRQRTMEFFPEERTYFQPDKNERGSIATDQPLDDLSFLYFARTLPLQVGQTYTLNRYFNAEGNPVTLKVLRRDTVNVPAGRFATIVVQPVIQTKGLFGKGGHAEVHFSDDDRRIIVQVRTSVPVVGNLNMYLSRYEPGQKLTSSWNTRAQR